MMSHPEYIAPCVEIIELLCIWNVVRSAIFINTFPGYSIQFPTTVRRTQFGSSCCCRALYVTLCPTGILLRAKEQKVFVPFLLLLTICLQVVQIILIFFLARGILFFF